MGWLERAWRRVIHGAIVWYLRKCWGAFHHNAYGPTGVYVMLVSERGYHECKEALCTMGRNDLGHSGQKEGDQR